MNQGGSLDISWGAILRIAIVFFALYLVYLIRDILVLSVFGLIISILFEIPIRFFEKKISRGLAVVFLYSLTFSVIALLIYLPASTFIVEIRQFVTFFPVYFEEIAPPLRALGVEAFKDIESFVNILSGTVQALTANIFNVLFSVFGGLASTVFLISIAIFFSLEGRDVERNLVLLFSKKDEEFILASWQTAQKIVSLWFLRTILACFFVGFFSYITFFILKTNYPVSLSLIAGGLNFVPIIGPIFTSFLIFVILSLDSWNKAFLAVIIFIIIQQVENNIFTPLITKKLIRLSPALVLISLTVGAKLFGLWGAVLTVPLVAVVVEFLRAVLERKRAALEG